MGGHDQTDVKVVDETCQEPGVVDLPLRVQVDFRLVENQDRIPVDDAMAQQLTDGQERFRAHGRVRLPQAHVRVEAQGVVQDVAIAVIAFKTQVDDIADILDYDSGCRVGFHVVVGKTKSLACDCVQHG